MAQLVEERGKDKVKGSFSNLDTSVDSLRRSSHHYFVAQAQDGGTGKGSKRLLSMAGNTPLVKCSSSFFLC